VTTPPYACQDCGSPMHVARGRCQACYAKWLLSYKGSGMGGGHAAAREKRAIIAEKLQAANAAATPTCEASPTGAHWWLVDPKNYGECKYCKQQRQFRPDLAPSLVGGLWR
jgi:hypothetical protein